MYFKVIIDLNSQEFLSNILPVDELTVIICTLAQVTLVRIIQKNASNSPFYMSDVRQLNLGSLFALCPEVHMLK